MVSDPVFFLILHLSFCDLLYCLIGLPSYWSVYYYGYYPFSEELCKYFGFFRKLIAYADFNTLALIAAYFAWRRGRGRPRKITHGLWPVVSIIIGIWVFCLCVTCIPLLGACNGQFGYDAVHGKCHVLLREKCTADDDYICLPGLVLEALGDGVPSLIVIISYSLVYRNLSQAKADAETWSLKRAVLILTICYFIFILPHAIIEWLPDDVDKSVLIGVLIHCWYWLVYIVNFFIYIIFWRRVRIGIRIFFRDMLDIAGWKQRNNPDLVGQNNASSVWWIDFQNLQ
eukprot:GFUD01003078.1.p1 GENE.GFUD01003078.1~~GFUD01003078.1.p1  ORF type:complete len:322 (+),score=42.73 GFUD01003078.1:112-966(+)